MVSRDPRAVPLSLTASRQPRRVKLLAPLRLLMLVGVTLQLASHGETAEPPQPVSWRAESLARDVVSAQDSVRARWRHVIVLREERGVGLTFSRLEESRWTVTGVSIGQVVSLPVRLRLNPLREARLEVEDELTFHQGETVAGRAERLLIGIDDQGHEVSVAMTLALRGDPPAVPQSPSAIAAPASPRNAPSRVSIRPGPGPGIVVQGVVNGRFDAAFLLDTGATHTILTLKALERFGVPILQDASWVSFIVAGGQRRDAPLVRLDSLELGNARVMPLDVLAFDVAPEFPSLDGVVGLDVLSRFTVTIDQAGGVVLLTPKNEP